MDVLLPFNEAEPLPKLRFGDELRVAALDGRPQFGREHLFPERADP